MQLLVYAVVLALVLLNLLISGVISIDYWNVSIRLGKGLEYTILVLVDGYKNNSIKSMYCCQSVREYVLERFGIMYTIYDNTYDMNNNDFIYKQQSDGGLG